MDLIVAVAYALGSLVCHQLPERSFFYDGRQVPVCARCTGLYLGGAAGMVAWIAVKAAGRWRGRVVAPRAAQVVVAGAGMPTLVSYVAGVTGLWDGTNLIRAALAVPLGLAAGAVVAAVATKDLR